MEYIKQITKKNWYSERIIPSYFGVYHGYEFLPNINHSIYKTSWYEIKCRGITMERVTKLLFGRKVP